MLTRPDINMLLDVLRVIERRLDRIESEVTHTRVFIEREAIEAELRRRGQLGEMEAMDFEQELQELTDAALEAGVSRVDILAILNAHVVTLTGEGALEEEAEHAEDEDDNTP
jgi:predicted transcriptional regulator